MTQSIICGECPQIYSDQEIVARLDGDERSLAELNSIGETQGRTEVPQPRASRLLGARRSRPTPVERADGPDLGVLPKLQAWQFFCPAGHQVDGNEGEQFPLAVLGASGASKSHFLPAIVWEMDHERKLDPLQISLTDPVFKHAGLASSVQDVYLRSMQLPPTDPGELHGPYGYRMRFGKGRTSVTKTMLLFDIAGEDLSDIVKIVQNAAYILLCKALIVLVDPVKLMPTMFDGDPVSPREQQFTSNDIRKGIRAVADTLRQVWHKQDSYDLEVPICFVVAKADSVVWSENFDWASETSSVLTGGAGAISEALLESSQRVRSHLADSGGRYVVEEIEELFNPEWIRYVAASATSQMPDGNDGWEGEPSPNGAALAVLQVLDLSPGGLSRPDSLSS